jgi:glycosyltransferase involved in cell wall biosynthesis
MLAPLNNIHTIRWANALYDKGIDLILAGATIYDPAVYPQNMRIISLELPSSRTMGDAKILGKLSYLKLIKRVRKVIEDNKIDIVHAHFASSYGLIGALAGHKPLIVSVWGSDIYDFPMRSFLHRNIIKFNLLRATQVLSTSYAMADETRRYTRKNIEITPFGVETNIFAPDNIQNIRQGFTIGIAKSLETKYGFEYLLKGYAKFYQRHSNSGIAIQLKIAGDGILKIPLQKLAEELGIDKSVRFLGRIKHKEIVAFYNSLDVAVFPSLSESFGVAALEANACAIPVIVSDAPGFKEIITNNKNGIIIERKSIDGIFKALEAMYLDPKSRKEMGRVGRELVKEKYEWSKNVNEMVNIYQRLTLKL